MAEQSHVIECEKVVREFKLGEDRTQRVLDELSFQVRPREYVILYGPSGCGKSTLLHLIAGLEKPDSGKILVRGEDITKFNKTQLARHHRSKIGLVFQQFNLIPTLTVQENIALPEIFTGKGLKTRTERAEHLLEIFGMRDLKDNNVNELSGGEMQRVAIARALANNPWILLIDEPTGNLDSKSAAEVLEIIEYLNKKSRRTILLVTHNQDYLHFAHRVLYMKDGKIIKEERKRPYKHLGHFKEDEEELPKLTMKETRRITDENRKEGKK